MDHPSVRCYGGEEHKMESVRRDLVRQPSDHSPPIREFRHLRKLSQLLCQGVVQWSYGIVGQSLWDDHGYPGRL